jgi:hypothetical protein
MAFGRRSNDTLPGHRGGGADKHDSDLPPHIVRLIETMDRIFRQAADMLLLLRESKPLPVSSTGMLEHAPIDIAAYEKLFEHVDDAGKVLFSTYYFTQDIKSLDPDAQYQLSLVHRNVLHFNLLASRLSGSGARGALETLAPPLDVILAKTAYFSHCFRSYTIVRGILSRAMDNTALNRAMQAHRVGWAAAMDRARSLMLNPDMLRIYAPRAEPSLLVSAAGPYQPGQRVIDGVVFPPDLAKVLMDKMASAQAQGSAMQSRAAS